MAKKPISIYIFSFLLLIPFSYQQYSSNPDINALIAFKSASDSTNSLQNWNKSTNVCDWLGVSCIRNRVSYLNLEGLGLTGSFEALASLNELRILSLKQNHLSGSLPDLSKFKALKLLFLSHNDFSGEFPISLLSLYKLLRLDLSYNNFSGQIPANINHLTRLLTLRLEENQFSGSISSLNLSALQDFNISGNRFSGEIPETLSRFPETAFQRNAVLCGSPLVQCKSITSDPSKPGAIASPLSPIGSTPAIVSSSPTSEPGVLTPISASSHSGKGKLSLFAIIAIIIGDILILGLISGLLFYYFSRKMAGKSGNNKNSQLLETEKIIYSSSPFRSQQGGGFERGNLVFFEGIKRFELEDLLRASAEMLGKGGFGTAYKAVLDNGDVVAVKRLKEIQIGGKREVFEQHMETLGKLRHGNVVSLKAYYFAGDEKLLVYEFMPNGSLFWLLHGNRGPGRTPVDWTTRLKIAAGVARGLGFIHHYSSQSPRLSHGNIKSTNVLIDSTGAPRLTDFGLSAFAFPTIMTRSNGYRAPEASLDGRKFSHQKADIYAFGVLLLEILTGKCPLMSFEGGGSAGVDLPRWVQSVVREEWTAEVFDLELMRYKDIEEEMVGLLQIGMSCTSVSPDQRPSIGSVVRMIEELRGVEEVSPSYESFDSMSESPSFSEDRTG
ncbi:Receptor-like protein kinase [Thalictrum thalictroides]|uniref:Receptor-like protein kinase n=1 Tax=Thalictrum thalictroides TaxID=46969 RepID=A0A7J6X079_THATH|nr:Receptor-like protein kinase [Thalictrum thalictroides]